MISDVRVTLDNLFWLFCGFGNNGTGEAGAALPLWPDLRLDTKVCTLPILTCLVLRALTRRLASLRIGGNLILYKVGIRDVYQFNRQWNEP